MLAKLEPSGCLLCIALLAAACSSPSGPKDQTAAEAPGPQPATAESQAAAPAPAPETPAVTSSEMPAQPVAEVEPAPAQPAAAPPATAASRQPLPMPEPVAINQPAPNSAAPPDSPPAPVRTPAPAPVPAPVAEPVPVPAPVPAAAPAPAAGPSVVDKGGAVAVAATKPGLSRVGSDTCETCHEVQFSSWSGTAHASRTPPLDCEGCHGPGSGYKSMAVMKDPAKARAAGLVIPDSSFCSQCHLKGANDALLKRAHAHEDEAG